MAFYLKSVSFYLSKMYLGLAFNDVLFEFFLENTLALFKFYFEFYIINFDTKEVKTSLLKTI